MSGRDGEAWREAQQVVGGEAGELQALRPGDGGVVWNRHVDGVVRGVGSDGELLFIGTLKGTLFAVRPPGERATAAGGSGLLSNDLTSVASAATPGTPSGRAFEWS